MLTAAPGCAAGLPRRLAKKLWPDDRVTGLLLRGAVDPADTATSGWAIELAGQAVGDFVARLGPVSAAARAQTLSFPTFRRVAAAPLRAQEGEPPAPNSVTKTPPAPAVRGAKMKGATWKGAAVRDHPPNDARS